MITDHYGRLKSQLVTFSCTIVSEHKAPTQGAAIQEKILEAANGPRYNGMGPLIRALHSSYQVEDYLLNLVLSLQR